MRRALLGCSFLACASLFVLPAHSAAARAKIWMFDRLDKIGGMKPEVLGHPKLIQTPAGKAIQFDGTGDAIFLPQHPLAGWREFTFEAIFRPESGGAEAQRWFHLNEQDPKTGADTDNRF